MMDLYGGITAFNDFISTPGCAYAIVIIATLGILAYTNFLKNRFASMNQALYFREELYRTLCLYIDDVLMVIIPDKHIVEYVSPNIERIYGISDTRIKKDPKLFFTNMDEKSMKRTEQLMSDASYISNNEIEFDYKHPITGEAIPSIMQVFPVVKKKLVTRYIINIRNITREKQTQKALTDALIKERKDNQSRKELISIVSHEIKAPVNAISALADKAAASLYDIKASAQCLERLQEASKNLVEIIDNILDMSRLDSDRLIIKREPFNLRDFLGSCSYTASLQAKQRKLNFEMLSDFDHEYLYGDTVRLKQILDNCIQNSIKFTTRGGNIRLEVSETGLYGNIAMYRFIISDNGKGIGEDFLGRIFNAFEQEDASSAEKYGGIGLGMYITKNLVDLMEGDIHVSSKPGEGTVVTIHLPFDIVNSMSLNNKN